jgi:hypothetical protein
MRSSQPDGRGHGADRRRDRRSRRPCARSRRSVFLVTFILAIPTLLALARIREREIDVAQAHGAALREVPDANATIVLSLVRQRPLLIFASSVLLLQLANAAMLPLMAGVVTTRSSQWAPVLIAACIIVPQAIVALTSPSVGRKAQQWGRRVLSLSETQSCWQLTSNRAMLLPYARGL